MLRSNENGLVQYDNKDGEEQITVDQVDVYVAEERLIGNGSRDRLWLVAERRLQRIGRLPQRH